MIDKIPVPENLTRSAASKSVLPQGCSSFILGPKNKSYKHQYSNIYFVRLRKLRQHAEELAARLWQGMEGSPVLVPRVLDVKKSQLCYVVGTVYLDMPMKPNILEDIGRDQSILAPPPPDKICSPEDAVYLEDESGRIKLTGLLLSIETLVTGVVMAVLGKEDDSSEFKVIAMTSCGFAPQPKEEKADQMDVDDVPKEEWIGLLSGLDIGSKKTNDIKHSVRLQLLVEYLTGEAGGIADQVQVARVTRLIIAGNSLAPIDPIRDDQDNLNQPRIQRHKLQKVVSTEPHPADILGDYLLDIGRSMPIHIMPGEGDPSSVTLPQQPLPRAMLGPVMGFSSFHCETNPTWLAFDGCTLLGSSGQPLSDMCKYIPDPLTDPPGSVPAYLNDESSLRLKLLTTTLRCRHLAPTAPDTLNCFPYFGSDPFILNRTPHLYFHGNQPKFETRLIEWPGIKCRVVCIPKFSETGELVLFNAQTLEVQLIQFDVEGMGKEGLHT